MRLRASHHALGPNSIGLVCVVQDALQRPPLFGRKAGGLKAANPSYWLMYQSAVWFIHQNSLPL